MKELNSYIISPWDSRYGELGHLWKKYNYNNIVKYKNSNPYYIIPSELVLKEYETDYVGVYFKLDGEWCNYVSAFSFKRILNITCNLTVQEYYDLIVLHNNNKSNRPRCIYCKGLMKFSGWITHGYSSSSKGIMLCSRYCQNNYQLEEMYSNLNNYPNVINRLKWSGKVLNSVLSNAKRLRSTFISYGDPLDECYFYIAITKSGKFKYGISNCSSSDRSNISSFNGDKYINIKYIYTDNRINIATLEALVKVELNTLHEYMEYAPYMSKFREAYLSALSRLKTNNYKL